ncbi:MAG: hypothetical protein ACUVTP_08430 [Candidatus Fervidibacter sp.]|uniref:hypothetical protein n=1 Tax=Candidatus Fervidibacter sp. TaxID=3100871 RepID=UPI00404A6017
MPLGYDVTRDPNALERLETIIHEAFHVFWFRGKKIPTENNLPSEDQEVGIEEGLKVRIAETVERECLARSLEAVDEKERNLWVKAFLEQRKIRRRLEGADAAKVVSEQIEETVEGVATFVSLKAMEAASKDYSPIPQIRADAEFYEYKPTIKIQNLGQLLRQEDIVHLKGAAQAFLLSQ